MQVWDTLETTALLFTMQPLWAWQQAYTLEEERGKQLQRACSVSSKQTQQSIESGWSVLRRSLSLKKRDKPRTWKEKRKAERKRKVHSGTWLLLAAASGCPDSRCAETHTPEYQASSSLAHRKPHFTHHWLTSSPRQTEKNADLLCVHVSQKL